MMAYAQSKYFVGVQINDDRRLAGGVQWTGFTKNETKVTDVCASVYQHSVCEVRKVAYYVCSEFCRPKLVRM